MRIVNGVDRIKMERSTGATRLSRAPLIYFGKYTKYEQIKDAVKRYKARQPIEEAVVQVKLLELKISMCSQAWKEMGASDELILCRSKVEATICERDCNLSFEERKEKFAGVDVLSFEKNLAKEVIEKTGEDVDYVKACRTKSLMAQLSEKLADFINLPEEKKPAAPELKTKEEIMNFIRMRVDSFYDKKFSYPEVLEDPIETLGV